MSEELLQRDLINNCQKLGKWDFYNIGATSVKALKEHGIIRNVNYGAEEKKKVDGLIVQKKNVIAVIEYKKPSEFKTAEQKNKAIKQELEVARKLDAHIIIATDTKETVWVNVLTGNKIKDESGKEIKTNFDLKDEKLPELIEKIVFSINELNDQIKPKQLVNPTDLAKQIWQDIWSVSGATPENCLYTFVELFIFKYLSDLGVLQGMYNFNNLYDSFSGNTEDEVLETYASIVRPKIKTLFPENPADKTTIINGTIFVSKDQKAVKGYSTVFKKVLTKFKDYGKLEHIDYDFKSQLFESFLKESISKKNWGQFFTPLKVVRAVVEMAKDDIKVGAKICDPACGVGKFLLEPVITKLDQFYEIKKGKLIPKITIHGYDKGFDKDEQKTIILAKANMLIYFSDIIKENPGITTEFAQLFNDSFILKTNSILGTLSEPVENEYDLIVTNPPYVTSGSSNLKDEIKKDGTLVNYYKINAIGVEGLFMEWIIRALKPNGKAFIIVPDGIFNRQNDKNLRQFIIDECYIDGIVSLPLNTFFTTNKKTYILCLTKKANKKDVQIDPVFTYLVSEIGETRDVYRFDIDQDDLSEAVTLYSFFKGNKASFAKINTDKRCKIFPFTDFTNSLENSWIIDKWWSEDEKIVLGISEKKEKLGLLDFSSLVEDMSISLKTFQEGIKELSEKKKSELIKEAYKLKDLFDIEKGKSLYTKNYGNLNKGDNPVYSASNNAPLTHINTYDYDGQYLTWATNGFAGYMMLIEGKFSINGDRGLLKPKMQNINLLYVKNIVEPKLRELAKGRKGEKGSDEFTKVYPNMVEEVEIVMPVDEKGNFDIETQKDVVDKILYVNDIKETIEEYKSQIKNLLIEIETENLSEEFLLSDVFDFPSIKGLTASFIQKNQGNVPVYGGRKDETPIGYIKDNLSNVKYFENCLAWNREGSVGFVFWHKHKFTTNDHHRPLIVKPQFEKLIDLDYMRYTLEKVLLSQGFEWSKTASKEKVEKFKVTIPILKSGIMDLITQKEIATKYLKIDAIKKGIIDELDRISKIDINFE
ncbi:MAG: N-6 DNA methylase [Weeksellaceae bacterium]|nr:N-6 DNA methylase [Weeksellaceae bacterium]